MIHDTVWFGVQVVLQNDAMTQEIENQIQDRVNHTYE
jgi:hypothetical protein